MSKTDTDVILTQYPARYESKPAISPIDFGRGPKHWRITGYWSYKDTLTRRRKWTVIKEILNEPGRREDITEELRRYQPGIFKDAIDKEASAILCDSETIIIVEEKKRSN